LSQNKCACYWPRTHDKVYLLVPDENAVEGRIGLKLMKTSGDKNFTVNEFELTREDLQVSCSSPVSYSTSRHGSHPYVTLLKTTIIFPPKLKALKALEKRSLKVVKFHFTGPWKS